MSREYQICTKCIMDTTDPDIAFDESGVCSHCREFEKTTKNRLYNNKNGSKKLDEIVAKIKEKGKNLDYDCIIGVSGGVDSTYVAYKVKQLGLRPLAVHFDSGWNSELAVNNIENIVKRLDIDLYTYVADWEEMRDLQLAFFKASLANCDIPQDHAFIAILYRLAAEKGVSYIISGHNVATESILPKSWGYDPIDLRHIKSIQKRFGTVKLKKYPMIGFFHRYIYYQFIKKIHMIPILNYMSYVKSDVKEFIKKELHWRDYGGKHYESVFTRFFQGYYLPTKFGFDKRKAHLSSLILSGQITREQALEELKKDIYASEKIKEDKDFVIKKLGICEDEFNRIMALPIKTYRDYDSNYSLLQAARHSALFLQKRGLLSS